MDKELGWETEYEAGNGKGNFLKSRAGEGCSWSTTGSDCSCLSTMSAFRRTQLLQPPDFPHTDSLEMRGPGCLVQGTLFTLFPLGGINKHIWCPLSPTGYHFQQKGFPRVVLNIQALLISSCPEKALTQREAEIQEAAEPCWCNELPGGDSCQPN